MPELKEVQCHEGFSCRTTIAPCRGLEQTRLLSLDSVDFPAGACIVARHDTRLGRFARRRQVADSRRTHRCHDGGVFRVRSEEHTSELQSQSNLVCRLLLEKKKKKNDF